MQYLVQKMVVVLSIQLSNIELLAPVVCLDALDLIFGS